MNAKEIEIGDRLTVEMEIAEDCVVFAGTHLCHKIQKNAQSMVKETLAAGMKKMVIVGDCDDHSKGHEITLTNTMKDTGIEYVWLYNECSYIRSAAPDFSETGLRRFSEAKLFGQLRRTLHMIGCRIQEINHSIYREKELLKKYPVVARIQAIESHDHNYENKIPSGRLAFDALFGQKLPNKIVSNVNAVALFDKTGKNGVLVTKSKQITFSTWQYFELNKDLDTLRKDGFTKDKHGSIRINIGEGAPEISLYCLPGEWKIKTHPELDVTDPDVHYIPMWQRVEK
jgi:hypothetical protein